MQPSLAPVFLVAALVGVSRAATYYVANDCEEKYQGISASFEEAWSMARKVAEKMNADNDDNQKFVYSQLFKDRDDAGNKGTIRDYYALLGGLTPVTDPKQADLIYVCDDDDRWEKLEGREVYNDNTYHMRTTKTTPGCKKESRGQRTVIANSYRQPLSESDEAKEFKPGRTVISVCNKLSRSFGGWSTVSKFDSRLLSKKMLDPDGKMQDVPSILDNPCTSRTLLHESFHSNLIDPVEATHKVDIKLPELVRSVMQDVPQYGWRRAVKLTPDQQFRNADNFAVYAFALEVFERGYKLGEGDDLANGVLVKIPAAAKEAMRRIRSLPSKCRNWIYRRTGKEC